MACLSTSTPTGFLLTKPVALSRGMLFSTEADGFQVKFAGRREVEEREDDPEAPTLLAKEVRGRTRAVEVLVVKYIAGAMRGRTEEFVLEKDGRTSWVTLEGVVVFWEAGWRLRARDAHAAVRVMLKNNEEVSLFNASRRVRASPGLQLAVEGVVLGVDL